VLVEQHPTLALSVADYGYVLSRGEIRMSGTADDLRTRLSEIESSYLTEASAPGHNVLPVRPADK
jgi:branched-chain amino acid transport system ATP-binding protein